MAIAAPAGRAAERVVWSAVRERFEDALEAMVCALLAEVDGSPVVEQVRWHFGIGDGAHGRRGKRLRPRLLFEVASGEGAPFERAVDAALAVEYLHNYSLVHDDIEDGDRSRHGCETVWARYGTAHGINAGDAMSALSYLPLLLGASGLPRERVVPMVRALHGVHLEMCAGQAYDIAFEGAREVGLDDYLRMIEGKTAALFGAACEFGALVAGADGTRAAAYGALGRAYGRAFQIHDDVIGTWGVTAATGKPCGGDVARRKWIFPIVWALAGPPSAARAAIEARYAAGAPPAPGEVAEVIAALDSLGARRAAADACARHLADAGRIAENHAIDRDGTVRELCAASLEAGW